MQFGVRVNRSNRWILMASLILFCAIGTFAADKKASTISMVDSGTFAVMMNGRRAATEAFSIAQDADGSTVTSQFKSEAGTEKAEQHSTLQLNANGDLRRYEWKEISPGQSHAVLEPQESFLIQHVWKNASDKALEQPFLLPASTTVLDDYFFIQREVLAWRYLATSCKQDKGIQCPKQKAQMGTVNSHARASLLVNVEYVGREKVQIHGAEKELIRLDISTENGDWSLWLDDALKLQRIVIPIESTEVIRD